ncbi:MAG: DUF2357 domain-containing protein, partial [Erysipelotrichaceae bacterium]|nr:DUF2357 domain-containing protein [Erysipelotrichaceae bacterium]
MRHQDRELIKVKTDKLEVIIKGSASHPFYDGSEVKEELSSLKIMCSEAFSGRINGEEISDITLYAEHKLQPLFFEQQSYQVLIVPNGDYKVEFWHDNLRVRESITDTGIKNVLMGNINFGNEIGFSDLVIRVDDNDYLKITIEVFPTKISYREDYEAIIQDVTSEVYNLAFDFLKKTYDSYDIEDKQQSSPVEFFTILKKIYGDFISAADMVLRKPHHLLETENEVLPGHKVKRVDNRSMKWIQKHPETTVRRDDRILVSKALAVKKHVTYDTKENRLTKYMLVNTVKRLEGFKEQYSKLLRDTDQEVINDIDTMIKEIRRRYDFGFLKDVNAVAEGAGLSLVFSMAPGYRDLYRCYLLLHRGLSITGSVFNISIKDLAVLYEYWCFIKLNSLMRKKY